MDKWLRLLVIVSTFVLLLLLISFTVRLLCFIPHTLILFSLGVLLAYALDPCVEWLRHTRLTRSGKLPSRETSVAVVVLFMLLVIGAGIWSLGGHLAVQISVLQHEFPVYQQRVMSLAAQGDQRLTGYHIHFSISQNLQHPSPAVQALASRIGSDILPLLAHFLATVGESVIVLLIAVYFMIYSGEMRELFNAALPKDLRERVELWQTDVNRILGGFVRGQLIIALLIGALAAVFCLLIGIRLWLIIGLIVVATSLIPVFGPYLGAIPAILSAIIGPTFFHNPVFAAVVVALYFIAINEIGSKVLYPKLVGQALGLHAVVVLFVLFAGLEIGGVLGVLFAAPITALIIVTVVHLYRLWQDIPDSLISNQLATSEKATHNKEKPQRVA